jgi:hypothetical protein
VRNASQGLIRGKVFVLETKNGRGAVDNHRLDQEKVVTHREEFPQGPHGILEVVEEAVAKDNIETPEGGDVVLLHIEDAPWMTGVDLMHTEHVLLTCVRAKDAAAPFHEELRKVTWARPDVEDASSRQGKT